MEKSLKSAYRRGIKIWCWEQELWSKSLSLGWPFGFPTLDLDFGKLFNCSQPQFPHTWGCLLWRMAMRVQRESTQSLVMLFLNVGREGLLRFSPRKILGQEEGQDPCSFIAEASGSKWFHPIHRAWKWWAAAPGSLPTRPCDFWETGQVSFELSILRKMQSSICAERVPWCRSAISIRSPWGLGVMVGVCWILTLLSQACKGAGGPQETLRCHTQWIPFCLVSVWSILYFLPVAVLSAALEGNRHEIHQTVLASAVKSFCRPALRAGGGSEQDGQRSPGGQGGHWCLGPALCLEDRVWGMVLLATAANYSHARLQGSRGAGSVSRQNKEVNYYLLGTHSVWNLLSAIDTLVQGKGMWQETEHQPRRRLLQISTIPLLFCHYSSPLPASSFSRKIPPQLCQSSESRPWGRKHLVCYTFFRKLTYPPGWQQPVDEGYAWFIWLLPRELWVGLSWELCQRDNTYELNQ